MHRISLNRGAGSVETFDLDEVRSGVAPTTQLGKLDDLTRRELHGSFEMGETRLLVDHLNQTLVQHQHVFESEVRDLVKDAQHLGLIHVHFAIHRMYPHQFQFVCLFYTEPDESTLLRETAHYVKWSIIVKLGLGGCGSQHRALSESTDPWRRRFLQLGE